MTSTAAPIHLHRLVPRLSHVATVRSTFFYPSHYCLSTAMGAQSPWTALQYFHHDMGLQHTASKASKLRYAIYRTSSTAGPSVKYGKRTFAGLKRLSLSKTSCWVMALILATGSDMIYTYLMNRKRESSLESSLALGSVPDIEDASVLAPRTSLKASISSLLQPAFDHGQYGMIIGNHGTGKTTLVRGVAHQHAGILYVDIQPSGITEQEFAETVAKALHFFPRSRVWFNMILSELGIVTHDVEDKRTYLVQVFDEFTRQAMRYRKKTNRPPVLVLDNINLLAAGNPGLLNILQDIAKDAADDGLFITIFVASEGQAARQMLGRSAWSRLGKVIVVEDLSKEEALYYLCNQHEKHPHIAEAVYEFTGGRISFLNTALAHLNSGNTIPGIRQQFLNAGREIFTKAKRMPNNEFKLVCLPLARKMLATGAISYEDFQELAGTPTTANNLLAIKIFTLLRYSNMVVFESKPIQLVAQEVVDDASRGWRSCLSLV
ncbi:unnamed protein product [Tuber aestivum]|uniref:ORC1/DEAH AAA+ ATPase domain-containing protein n=1 Tax=Tuber aestivum TaxID=59557 RepID=A0A292PXP1_9PEZI|nr:unnamed protein product [Tuber aestivum]